MSRIHQAIRRAEKEKAPEAVSRIEFNGNSFDSEYIIRKGRQRIQPDLSVVHEFGTRLAPESVTEVEPSESVDLKPAWGSKIVTVSEPTSLASRQFHLLAEKLREIRLGKCLQTISVTSFSASEGKTLTAVNLAVTLAREIHQKILLVDASLKNPGLNSLFGLASSKGLVEVLAGDVSHGEVTVKTGISNLYVLPSGEIKADFNSTCLPWACASLNSEALKDFLAHVKEQFDWVILDSPSVIPLEDADLLTASVDGILVVVRASHPPTQLILNHIQPLKNRNVLGLVMNGVRVSARSAR